MLADSLTHGTAEDDKVFETSDYIVGFVVK